MRLLILCLPVLLMFCGAFWLAIRVRQTPHEQRGPVGKRLFMLMSYGVGVSFVVWAGFVLLFGIVEPAFPLIFMLLGLMLIWQGWIFNRIYK